jgi:hypothetical protein
MIYDLILIFYHFLKKGDLDLIFYQVLDDDLDLIFYHFLNDLSNVCMGYDIISSKKGYVQCLTFGTNFWYLKPHDLSHDPHHAERLVNPSACKKFWLLISDTPEQSFSEVRVRVRGLL